LKKIETLSFLISFAYGLQQSFGLLGPATVAAPSLALVPLMVYGPTTVVAVFFFCD